MASNYQITGKRKVPNVISGRGIISGRQFTETPIHAGEWAICVKLESGYMAWGFANNIEDAENNAVEKASKLELA